MSGYHGGCDRGEFAYYGNFVFGQRYLRRAIAWSTCRG